MQLARMINAVDVHGDGLPGRVITGGVGPVPGETMLDKALMLREPRGYPGSCSNLVLPSNNPAAQYGYVIMEHVEYPAMSHPTRSASRRLSSNWAWSRSPNPSPLSLLRRPPG